MYGSHPEATLLVRHNSWCGKASANSVEVLGDLFFGDLGRGDRCWAIAGLSKEQLNAYVCSLAKSDARLMADHSLRLGVGDGASGTLFRHVSFVWLYCPPRLAHPRNRD